MHDTASQITLFTNFDEKNPTAQYYTIQQWTFCTDLFTSLKQNPSRRVTPVEYFTFMETHWAGCGCFMQTDGRVPQNLPDIISAAIGFR